MERFTCRTCLSVADVDESFEILEILCLPEKTLKDVLLQYVPQMENTLSETDRICALCLNTLTSFIQFVEKCIEIEEHLKNEHTVIENIGYEQKSDDEDVQIVENIQIVLDKNLKPYFPKFADTPGTSSSSTSINPPSVSINHDHAYIKPPDPKAENDVKSEIFDEVDQGEDLTNDSMGQEDSFDGIGNMKLIPVATVTEAMLGESFMEACNAQEDNSLRPNITVLATGGEFIDPAIIQIKEESSNSLMDGVEEITYYKSLADQSSIYICELCGDGFLKEDLLRDHYLLHGEVRLMCDKCPKVFKNDSALKAHYKLKHLEVERFKCETCGQLFGRVDYLRNHCKRHEEEKTRENVKCRVPGKFLRFKNTDDPLPCKICGKYYNGIQKLKVHLQTHLVVKRFACEYCDLTYKRWPSLKRHERTHLEASTIFHRCNVCWKRFYTTEELDFHMSQHGNPRYRCQVCDEQFHRKYLFDNHYLLKHATPEDIESSKKEVIYDTLLELSNQNMLVSE